MKKFSLFVSSAALSLALLAVAACSATNHTAAHSSPTPAASAGPVVATDGQPAPPPAASPPVVSSPAHPHDENEEGKMPRVNGADAKRLVAAKQAVLVDVRGEDAYKLGHAEGALLVPLEAIEKGEHKSLPRNKRLIAYCA